MNNMIELSFIIPIYNTPIKDLEKCFFSVLEIKQISYEVLLIDDGSKREIANFCQSFSCKHSEHFRYYQTKNYGVSKARNEGIKNSIGRYICFLDSDDTIEPNVIQQAIKIKDVDIVIFNMTIVENGKSFTWKAFECQNSTFISYKETFERTLYTSAINGCCGKIFRKSILEKNKIFFIERMRTSEDLTFVLNCLETKPVVYYLNKTGYFYYRNHSNSTSRIEKYPLQTIDDIHYVHQLSKKLAAEFNLSDQNEVIDLLNKREIHKIFRWCCEQINAKQFTSEKKKIVVQYSHLCSDSFSSGINANRIMYFIISNEKWHLLSIVACLRRMYLLFNKHIIRIKKEI